MVPWEPGNGLLEGYLRVNLNVYSTAKELRLEKSFILSTHNTLQ